MNTYVANHLDRLIDPSPLDSAGAKDNILGKGVDILLDRAVDPKTTYSKDLKNISLGTALFAAAFFGTQSFFCYYSMTEIYSDFTAKVILNGIPVATMVYQVGKRVFATEESIRDDATMRANTDLVNNLNRITRGIKTSHREQCKQLSEMTVYDIKQNIKKMSRHDSKLIDEFKIDNALKSLLEKAKEFAK